MTTLSATQARNDFFDLIKKAVKKRQPTHIVHKDGDVILMSKEEYESLVETLDILSSPEMMKEIQAGLKALKGKKARFYTLDELFS